MPDTRKVTRRWALTVALAGAAGGYFLVRDLDYPNERGRAVRGFTPVALRPSQILNLRPWKINLPAGNEQVTQPALASYEGAAFKAISVVQFTATCGGEPQPGSKYPRSELREMNPDGTAASWSPASGEHVMELTQRITHLPVVKPQLICGQIHSGTEYLIMIELDARRLYVRDRDAVAGVLDDDYQLGTFFDLQVRAADGFVTVFYNGVDKVRVPLRATGCYFKAGCYVQSSTSTGDLPTAYGQVEISRLTLSHA
jgi:hypothetical protein